MAVTEPFPLVPAMWTTLNARSGWPSSSTRARILSRPNLIPNCSRLNRYSRCPAITGPSMGQHRDRLARLGGPRFLRHRGCEVCEGDGDIGFGSLGAHEAKGTHNQALHFPAIDNQVH